MPAEVKEIVLANATTSLAEYEASGGYAQLARAMQADPPFIFLWQVKNFEGTRKRVQGYTTRSNESMGHVAFDVGVTD